MGMSFDEKSGEPMDEISYSSKGALRASTFSSSENFFNNKQYKYFSNVICFVLDLFLCLLC